MTVTVIVLDSVGVGELPDAASFGDLGAHTLDHALCRARVDLPNFQKFGFGNIDGVFSILKTDSPIASFGKLNELSPGKDTSTGHWEFMGVVLEHAFKTMPAKYPSFPKEIMNAFDKTTGHGHLANYSASGTKVIEDFGAEHLKTGNPIVYTSADSVFQIAAHIDVVPLETLYEWSRAARKILKDDFAVARVIARPFKGELGNFERIGSARKDFALNPPHETVLDKLLAAGKEVIGIGKIPDIYNHNGFSQEIHSDSNLDGIEKTLVAMKERPDGFIFTNLVEFDSLYGHRRKPVGYANALLDVDNRLEDFIDACQDDDVLIFISDHGNDPTFPGSDHTREYGMLLAYSPNAKAVSLGTRASFADVGATVADLLNVSWDGVGESFSKELS